MAEKSLTIATLPVKGIASSSNSGQPGFLIITDDAGKVNPEHLYAGGPDITWVHNQGVAASTWVINHTMEKFPAVTIVDSSNTVVTGKVVYNSTSQITLTFSGAFSGKAYLN